MNKNNSEIIGVPSGLIISLTKDQLKILIKNEKVFMIHSYKGMYVGDWCFYDEDIIDIKKIIMEDLYKDMT